MLTAVLHRAAQRRLEAIVRAMAHEDERRHMPRSEAVRIAVEVLKDSVEDAALEGERGLRFYRREFRRWWRRRRPRPLSEQRQIFIYRIGPREIAALRAELRARSPSVLVRFAIDYMHGVFAETGALLDDEGLCRSCRACALELERRENEERWEDDGGACAAGDDS